MSALAILAPAAFAQSPSGGKVARGSATITKSSKSTVVKQSSNRAVVDWKRFDVGRDHTVEFKQPGRSSATLNRVQSHRPSVIDGAIKAPGTVVIQNTAGVTFSGTARVDVGGLLATSQIVDADHFMDTGNFRIGGGERPGAVVENAGRFAIEAEGLAALVGSNVTNSGEIVAQMGTVVLASGDTTTIDLAGDGVFQVAVDGTPQGGQVTQSGRVDVGGGRVLISAGGAAGMLDTVINTSGITRAVSGSGSGGRIELVGRGGGAVNVSGTLDASGRSTGGRIEVTGQDVVLSSTARLDATGAKGGDIYIGGGLQGSGDLRRAQRTVLNYGSEVRADGTAGDGGTVIVWSDGSTWFDGLISAIGTKAGGFVETSGKVNLGTGNAAEVRVGQGGQWLLDPRDVRIANTGADVGGGTTNPPDAPGVYQIRSGSIVTALNAGSDVTITTEQPAQAQDGNITVDSNIRWTGTGNLTLLADGSIRLNRNIQASGDGSVTLTAAEAIDARRTVQTRGAGDITMSAGTTASTRALLAFGAGDIMLTAREDITLAGTVQSRGGGDVTVETDGAITAQGTLEARSTGGVNVTAGTTLSTRLVRTLGSGNVNLTAGSDLVANQTIEARGSGGIALEAGGALTLSRNVQTRGVGDIALEAGDGIVFQRNVQALGSGDLTVTAGGDLVVNRTAQTRGGDFVIDVGGDIRLNQPVTSRNGGSVTAEADGSIFVDRTIRMRGSGDMTLTAGDRIDVNQQIRREGAGDLTLAAGNNVTIDASVFANADGSISVTSQAGDILFGGGNGNQRISTNRGDVNLAATTGSVQIARTNTQNRRTEVYAQNGNVSMSAGTEILLLGGDRNRTLARIGRSGDGADITLEAPTVRVRGGDGSNRATAQVIAGLGGSITVEADLLEVQSGATGALASIDAIDGASLTLDSAIQRWNGRVRADGTGPTGGDVSLTGNITATVEPVFDLNDGASFALNTGNPTGALTATGLSFDVTTTGNTISVDGILDARGIALITDTGVSLGAGAAITARGPGNALVVSAADRFENAGGPDVLSVTDPSARWLLYINTFDGLEGTAPASGTFDLYNRSFSANPPSSLDAFSGNRIVFAEQPTLLLTATDVSKVYGSDGASLLSFTTEGLRGGDTLDTALDSSSLTSAGTDPGATVSAGPYVIVADATASQQGYNVVTENGLLTVTPAPLTVTAQDESRPVGEPNPPFGADITGFVLGENESVLDGVLSFSTPATINSPDGLYPITPAGLSGANYAITFVDGTLTVGTGVPPVEMPPVEMPPVASPGEGAPTVVVGVNDAGAREVRRASVRALPLTPGDASFRVSNRDVALAESNPFSLTFSLGEVLAFAAPDGASASGFVPAAGTEDDAEGFVPAAGAPEEEAGDVGLAAGAFLSANDIDCGAAVNLGSADRGGCQSVAVTESYWTPR